MHTTPTRGDHFPAFHAPLPLSMAGARNNEPQIPGMSPRMLWRWLRRVFRLSVYAERHIC
ncbi:hypothetical protein FIBSPDRAFT_1049466 [Athelia psychrophila]|uniref:Uncharacterized protein n=1 Tax=Athelia psychrophila TaxID=1759441 RepID=A0A166C6N5_9AGAM|nr:hypothetical protein FIBSPDRAFT_1049466 [Fibularhizoctonia sp. CBS 109695]